jgi:hypothetical protein
LPVISSSSSSSPPDPSLPSRKKHASILEMMKMYAKE